MKDDTRAAIADLAMCGVVAVAVYYVVRNPVLRHRTWRLLKYGAFTAAPTWLWQETARAWTESRIANQESRIMSE